MTDISLTFFRWARLRDFSEMGLALRKPELKVFIDEGYMEETATAVVLTPKGHDALTREPVV